MEVSALCMLHVTTLTGGMRLYSRLTTRGALQSRH